MIAIHLSRLSEDFIIWSTSEFGFVKFSDAFSAGSSSMPQKRNPDIAELTRGKTGRLYGNLISILTTMKALPSSYNRDMQEDKEALFDSVDTVRSALEVFAAMLPELKISPERMQAAASDSNLFATDLASGGERNAVSRGARNCRENRLAVCREWNSAQSGSVG